MTNDKPHPADMDSNERARIAGHGRNPDADAPSEVQADLGKPEAEYGAYGLVRKGSKEAQGLSEPQIRGVEPMQPDPDSASTRSSRPGTVPHKIQK